MSNLSPFLLLAAVAGLATPAVAALPAASVNTVLFAASTLVPTAPVPVISLEFGSHQAVAAGGQARASLSVGADGTGVPFIAFSAAASGRFFADAYGSLAYHWVVQGALGSSELVPVTITSLGNIRGQFTGQSLRANVRAGASVNGLTMGISNTFETATTGGRQDIRNYGLESGNVNFGVTNVVFTDPALSAPGGSVTATGEASLSESFTLMVYPNVANRIVMRVKGYGADCSSDLYACSWAINGFLDPVITIDPGYASRFSVLQSDIPMVPVPEASTWAMLLAGLGLLMGVARRRA